MYAVTKKVGRAVPRKPIGHEAVDPMKEEKKHFDLLAVRDVPVLAP